MFGSAILDTAVGLVLVFLIFSLVASSLREVVELVLKRRAKELEAGMRELLHATPTSAPSSGDLAQRIYRHPLVNALYSGQYEAGKASNLPSYIPASNFALALMDEVVRGRAKNGTDVDASSASPPINLLNLRRGVDSLGNTGVQRVVLASLDTAGDDLSRAQASIEAWYDSAMDRVSGRYKRHTHRVLLVLGLLIAIAANVNPIRIARFLYHDKTARDVLVAQAGVIAKDSTVLNADGARHLIRRAVLVRLVEQGHGDPLHREAS